MVNIFVLLLLIGEGIILGILFFVLRCKHSKYPDFRVGYHVEDIMGSEEKWDYANKTAGNLCGIFGIVFFVISALMYCLQIASQNGHLCHIRRPPWNLNGGQPRTH